MTNIITFFSLALSQTTNIYSSKLKEFADDGLKFDKIGKKLSKRAENTKGKRAISPFSTVFSKDIYDRHVKSRACLAEG